MFLNRKTETEYAMTDAQGNTLIVIKLVTESISEYLSLGENVMKVILYTAHKSYICEMAFDDFKMLAHELVNIYEEFLPLHELAFDNKSLKSDC